MNRSEKKALVEDFEKRILRCVEEIDDTFFVDENKQKIVSFAERKSDFIHIEINEKEEEANKIVFIFRYETETEERLKQRIVSYIKDTNLSLKDYRIQLIGVVEGLHERNELSSVLRVYKTQICKDANISAKKATIDVLFIPSLDNKPIEVGVVRMNSIIFPEPNINFNVKVSGDEDKGNIKGYLFIVKLSELVDIYNRVGEDLFSSNLRYGISDQLSLENSMRQTLIEEPDMFWFYNNGVTIVTDKTSNISLENPLKITFTDSWNNRKLDFSVINGAQTISTAARIFGDKSIDQKTLNHAKDNAKVLLRVITTNHRVMKRKITIALNRQKPIKAEDIAFQTPFVSKFNSYMEEREARNEDFLYIIKRGEENYSNTIQLPLFAQLVYTCFMHPTEARNNGPSKLYMEDINQEDLKDEYFKNEFSDADSKEKQTELYLKYYHELIWVFKLYKSYSRTLKEFTDEKTHSILANNRWSFISYVLLCMQGQKYDTQNEYKVDYTHFKENNELLANIKKYMEAFAGMVNDAYAYKREGYTPDASKTKDFWEKICEVDRAEIFEKLYVVNTSDASKLECGKDSFIEELLKAGFEEDEGEYRLNVDSAVFGSLKITINGDESFNIGAELFNPYYGSEDMTEDEIYDAYGDLIDEVNEAFTDKLGIEPCVDDTIPTMLGGENPDCNVSYNNIPFEIGFVNSFIELMMGVI
ncbi:AIPR protein [Lachnospiraceae bacterium XBD2001]|nr:AIPR protein [Lachnospiraceae bacterium XBD2001]